MISNAIVAGSQSISLYSPSDSLKGSTEVEQTLPSIKQDEVTISAEAQQLFGSELSYGSPLLSEADEKRVNEINSEIDKILGTEEIKFSKADEKSAGKLYQQIDSIFADNKVTKEEEKQLAKIDRSLADIYEKYDKPLTKEQEQKLEGLFAELDNIFGIEEDLYEDSLDGLFQELGLSKADQEKADELNAQIDKVLGTDSIKFTQQDLAAAEKLFEQMERIFADDAVTEDEEKQLAELDQQLETIYQKYEKPLTKEDEQKLDELFAQLDKLYGLS